MYKVLVEDINDIIQQTVIFAHTNKLKISDIANAKTNPTKNL